MVLLLALVMPALAAAPAAAPAAWYSADQVAARSSLFAASSQEIGPRYQRIEAELRRLSPAIEDLDLATALAGSAVSSKGKTYALDLRKQATALLLSAQQQVDVVQDGYAAAFGSALERALADVGAAYRVEECEGGSGVQAMMGRARSCEGEDLNAALAARLDQDPALAAEVARINAMLWPAVTLEGSAQAVIELTGGGSYVQLAPAARMLWGDRLVDHSDDLDRVVAPLEDAVDAQDPDALAAAGQARKDYEAALAADGQVLLALLGESLGRMKKGAGDDTGLCLNPESLGGCPGEDRTEQLLPLLRGDRKLDKALDALP